MAVDSGQRTACQGGLPTYGSDRDYLSPNWLVQAANPAAIQRKLGGHSCFRVGDDDHGGDQTGACGGPASGSGAGMAMTVEQIVHEARQLPREQAAELFDRLLAESFTTPDPETDAAWQQEVRRRITEIEAGREPGVDGDEVMAEVRKIVGR